MSEAFWAVLIVLVICLLTALWMFSFGAVLVIAGIITVIFVPLFVVGFVRGVRDECR